MNRLLRWLEEFLTILFWVLLINGIKRNEAEK